MDTDVLIAVLRAHRGDFHPVVPFEPGRDRLYPFDFTAGNTELGAATIADTEGFAGWINARLRAAGARYGIGGYGEHRTLYARSSHFGAGETVGTKQGSEVRKTGGTDEVSGEGGDGTVKAGAAKTGEIGGEEPRRLHLGIDVWGPAGTKVMSPMDGIIHSYAFNNRDSDYGATVIVTHNLDGVSFHLLYGHLSLNSLKNLHEGKRVSRGDVIGEMGMRFENGNWPPHLHFQLIGDMGDWKGDFPGVCKFSERAYWLSVCPDPEPVLQMMRYV